MEKKLRLPPRRGKILKGILKRMIGLGGGGRGGLVTPLKSSSPDSPVIPAPSKRIPSAQVPSFSTGSRPSEMKKKLRQPPPRGQILRGILKRTIGLGGTGDGGRVTPPNSPVIPAPSKQIPSGQVPSLSTGFRSSEMKKKLRLPPPRGQILKGILKRMAGREGSDGGGRGGRVTPPNSSSPNSQTTCHATDDVGPTPLHSVIPAPSKRIPSAQVLSFGTRFVSSETEKKLRRPPPRGQILKGILKSMFGWGSGGGGDGGRVAPPDFPTDPAHYISDDVGPTQIRYVIPVPSQKIPSGQGPSFRTAFRSSELEKKLRLPPPRGQLLKGILKSTFGCGGSGGGGGGRVAPLNSPSPDSPTNPNYYVFR